MQKPRLAQAADDDWGQLAKNCADQLAATGGNGAEADVLGILYVTDHLAADMSSLLTFLRERTGIEAWIGTVGMGVCATKREYFDRPAVVAMTLPFPAGSIRVAEGVRDEQELEQIDTLLGNMLPGIGIVHGDPRNPETGFLIDALSEEASCFLVGGLSASRSDHGQIAGHVTEGGVSGVFIDADVPVVTGLTQGCAPIGPARAIDVCDDDVLCELGGKSPKDLLEEDMGLAIDDEGFMDAVQDVHVAILVPGSDTGDYMVRNLTGIDPQTGWLSVGETPSVGDRLMFCRRNAEAAEKDLRRMLADVQGRAGGQPRAGIYHSCVARGPNLFAGESREMEIIGEVFGDMPLVGFFGNGEISHNRLYGYTGILTLFL